MDAELTIADIDRDITSLQDTLSLYPRSHSVHFQCVYNLAHLRWERYQKSREKEDLDKFIVHNTTAIFLLPASRASDIPRLFFSLIVALQERSEQYEQPEGIEYCIKYLRYLRGFPIDSLDIPRSVVTTSLIRALGTQVDGGAGNEIRDVKEMVILGRELLELTSGLPARGVFLIMAFVSLAKAADAAETRRGLPIQLLDDVIGCLRDSVEVCPPGSDNALFPLAFGLVEKLHPRFITTHSLDDYEKAMTLVEKMLDPNQPGGCPDPIWGAASILSTRLALARSAFFKNPEYSEVKISRLRTTPGSSFIDEELRFHYTEGLLLLVERHFGDYRLSMCHEVVESNTSPVAGFSPTKSLETSGIFPSETGVARDTYSITAPQQKIENFEELLSNTAPGTEHHKECLSGLADEYKSKFHYTKDPPDIIKSIKYRRLSLNVTHASDPWRVNPLISQRNTLFLAFKETRDIGYLHESIAIDYDILELKTAQQYHFHITQGLVHSLFTRGRFLGRREDFHEAIRLLLVSANHKNAPEPDRFLLSCRWAILARNIGHPTTLTAYKSAMSLIQKSLSFAPTLSVQHTRLVAMGKDCQMMPLDCASYQIYLGQFEEAVETLEQGRAILWSEMRGLRTTVIELFEDSPLAKRFVEINQELGVLTMSVTPSKTIEIEDGVAQDWLGPFGRLVITQQKLVAEREALISQIQSQPGLERFLSVPSFTELRSAASRGPVVLINHCKWRSDIVIIFHKSLPCSIPTTNDFYARANKLRDELAKARKCGLNSGEYQDALCSVLKGLYELVGEPVIKRLRLSGVREQSRIWWCPTSVFCSLPLHAMGPIPSSKQYFSDLYIPSYTPSLSALIESREARLQISERPSLLLVAQPDDTVPGVNGEIDVILERASKARIKVTSLVSSEATPSSVLDGLRGSQFAHFACHGVLETGKPFDASFQLHDGSYLTLLDIARSRLPDAEFAFLSCCHTAAVTEESLADEALHLTAAMQYGGFRSVVGTMWEMADTDGAYLAENFYKSLFSSRNSGVPHYERSAGALRGATQKLRRNRGVPLERWVNFVHYGA